MSNLFIASAFRDIIPTAQQPFPPKLISYANSTYQSTKMSLPLNATEEAARYHICCFAVVEFFQQKYNLPDPIMNKIPIPARRVNALLPNVRITVNRIIESSTPQSTPFSTPQSNRVVDYLQTPTSQNNTYSKATQSYIDQVRNAKLQSIDHAKKSLKDKLMTEGTMSPPTTPKKPKASPVKYTASRPRTKSTITTPSLIAFCNQFYIPEHITVRILQTYKIYRHVVGNSWGLLVGLVGISYLKLNKAKMSAKMGLRAKVVENLHRLQQGGLTQGEVKMYMREVARMIASQKWIKDAKFESEETEIEQADNNDIEEYPLTPLNSYLDPSVGYYSMMDSANVEKWVRRIKRTANV